MKIQYNTANILTLFRIATIPIILAMILIQGPISGWVAFFLFCIAGITDFFDGYFARIRKEQTNFGTILDPIADKLLVASVLLVLTAKGTISEWSTIPALIILLREIIVAGLREFLAGIKVSIPVSRIAKFKTTIQILALGLLILSEGFLEDSLMSSSILWFGKFSLWLAAILTLYTGYDYLKSSLQYFK